MRHREANREGSNVLNFSTSPTRRTGPPRPRRPRAPTGVGECSTFLPHTPPTGVKSGHTVLATRPPHQATPFARWTSVPPDTDEHVPPSGTSAPRTSCGEPFFSRVLRPRRAPAAMERGTPGEDDQWEPVPLRGRSSASYAALPLSGPIWFATSTRTSSAAPGPKDDRRSRHLGRPARAPVKP